MASNSQLIELVKQLTAELKAERARHSATRQELTREQEAGRRARKDLASQRVRLNDAELSTSLTRTKHKTLKRKFTEVRTLVRGELSRRSELISPTDDTGHTPPMAIDDGSSSGVANRTPLPLSPSPLEAPSKAPPNVPPDRIATRERQMPIPFEAGQVLTRRERAELPARACPECAAFFAAIGVSADTACAHMSNAGRHRTLAIDGGGTPSDFWPMSGFGTGGVDDVD